jgi:hypothetical protein
LLAVAVLSLSGCPRKKVDPAALPPTAIVQDFEHGFTIKRWPKDGSGQATFSTEWAADGKRSLRLDAGMMGSFKELSVSDWTGYGALRFTVHNPSSATVGLGLEIQDEHDDFDDRHQHSFGAPPGDHVLELDFSGGLWRGEENRPYRGKHKTPIDTTRITRLAFVNRGSTSIHIDALTLVKVAPITTPGGFAFDFGLPGKQVMSQTVGVYPDTRYTAERGFGFLGETRALRFPMSYPTPLLGDGIAPGESGFRVDLPGGAYVGVVSFERGGFWEGEQSGYEHADLLVNGAVVTGHDFSPSGPHFLFRDLEITDPARIEADLVHPAHAITRFRFQAAAGQNVFTLAVKAPNRNPLRIAGLLLAPDTPAGAAFLDAHEARQHEAILTSYPPEDRSRRDAPRAPPGRELIASPVPLGAQVYPRDLPETPGGAPPRRVLAVTGQTAALQLALHAQHRLAVHAEPHPLKGPNGATLPAPSVSHGRYLPTRPLGNGPVWIETTYFRPEPDFSVAPDLARAVLLEWRIPRDAAPGLYTGSLAFTAGAIRLEIPLEVRVYAVDLPPLPIPVGLLMNALPFGPEAVGEERYWELEEALLDEQGRAGLNMVTGGAALYIDVHQEGADVRFDGDRAIRYLARARAHGMARAVVSYGGFFPPLQAGGIDPAAFSRAFLAYAKEHDFPPFYFDNYDEPKTRDELGSALFRTQPYTRAGLFTMGFNTGIFPDFRQRDLLAETYAPALSAHDPGDLAGLARIGRHPWVYNNGLERFDMGLQLWRNIKAGAEGRVEWIGLITQGFAFDNLDGREPANSCWLVHDKLGIMPAPRWLSAREGLLDARIRLALEKAVPEGDPALAGWSMEGYGKDRAKWDDAALESARWAMLERLAHKR